jgi:hypothetical protein
VQVQQSALVRQLARQAPSTQVIPLLQFAFEVQLGWGRTSGSQRPLSHMSCAGQLLSITHAA